MLYLITTASLYYRFHGSILNHRTICDKKWLY